MRRSISVRLVAEFLLFVLLAALSAGAMAVMLGYFSLLAWPVQP